ncbi:MAG: AGE family epimerase/isomerase [Opitutaceae bacterium]|jgi:mannobiose 2-epimerase
MRSRLLSTLLFLMTSVAASAADAWQQRWSEHLSRDVLPYWQAQSTANTSRADDPRTRYFMPQLRLLYVASVGIARETDSVAQRALRKNFAQRLASLVEQFQDTATGDWNALARSVRSPQDAAILSMQDQAWAVYLLADIHARTGDPAPLQLARQTFARIDRLAHDEQHAGYYLTYSASGASMDRQEHGGRKYAAVQLHMLLALARLRSAAPADELLVRRFDEVRPLIPRFVSAESGHARWALTRDWKEADFSPPADNQTLYGQNAEIITYLLDATTSSGGLLDGEKTMLESIARGLLRDGISPDGAVYFRGPMKGAATDRRIWWWPQAETAAALWRLHALTGNADYLDGFHRVSAWTFAHTLPPQNSALWRTLTDADGRELPHGTASHELQTGFHAIRSLLLIEKTSP